MTSYRLTKRGIRILFLVILAFVTFLVTVRNYKDEEGFNGEWSNGQRLPPLYDEFREQEQHLDHYEVYEKKPIKYLCAANHAFGSGWGNVMQELVLTAVVAYATKRSYVFDDYIWSKNASLYTEFNGKLIPSRVPLTALVSGPFVGGSFPPGDDAPRAVSMDFFNKVCPNPTVIHTSIINDDHVRYDNSVSALEVFDMWVEKLNSMDDQCIMLDEDSPRLFDYWVFGIRERILPVYPVLVNNPIITNWGWSPVVYAAYQSNKHLFQPPPSLLFSLFRSAARSDDYNAPIPGLLALHVRRGDFEGHCRHLANWNADWNAWNALPGLPDPFVTPSDGGAGEASEATINMYNERCYPSIEQIVEKVKDIVAVTQEPLKYVYIMTNGDVAWVDDLKAAIRKTGNWHHVGSSRDLKLTWEQKFVSHGLDMLVASRAQVLVGNGWSSLTSNVVLLRLAHGMPMKSNRFW